MVITGYYVLVLILCPLHYFLELRKINLDFDSDSGENGNVCEIWVVFFTIYGELNRCHKNFLSGNFVS